MAAGAVFVAVERRVGEPVLPLGILKVRNFAVATGIGGLFNFCLYGTLFSLALYPQRAWSLGALATGMWLVAGGYALVAGLALAERQSS